MGAQDQRPRFYEGQYLSAEDLAAIVEYLRAADARHALGAHTWGISTGLYFTERPAPGEADRVDVTLQPGLAWDGFGRPLLVAQPTRLPESLFEGIEPNPIVDSPPPPAQPTGRLVKVWLGYEELGARPPAPGFESCLSDDQNARVRESFRFYIGDFPPGPEMRSPVTIGAVGVDAPQALRRFDPAADLLWDASVPHQNFPLDARPPRRWLVPIGYVRWVARAGAAGYFLKRDKVAADQVEDKIRAFRINVGTVAEYIESAASVILLHRRGEQRDIPHRYLGLLRAGHRSADLLSDLVWVEGNLRVEGDAKLAGGRLLLRDLDGLDHDTPLYLARTGDLPGAAPGNRELRAVIGPDAQTDNRFIVGREGAGAPTPAISPNLVVTSGGNVGVNVAAPDSKLHIRSANPQQGELRIFSTNNDFEYDGGNDSQFVFRDLGRGVTAFLDTKVGVGTVTPQNPLGVRATGTSEELVSFEAPDGATKWHLNQRLGGTRSGLNFVETGVADGRLFLKAGGDVGVGTTDPQGRLTIEGRVPAQGRLTFFTASNSAEYDGGTSATFTFRQSVPGVTSFLNTRVGVGTTTPRNALAVRGVRVAEELLSFETPTGVTKWHINQALVGGPRGLNFVETGVADGRLYLREGGNVGIGTTDPREKLHVSGSFLRVDGAGNEQAYIGGDGRPGFFGPDVLIGSLNSSVWDVHLWNRGFNDWMWLVCDGTFVISDAKRKTNIESLSGSLDRLCKLRGVKFDWLQRGDTSRPERKGIGVIAQEVAQVVPELVRPVRGDLAVSYNELVPLLIEAVKELKTEVDELRAQFGKAPAKDERPRDRD